MIPYIELHTVVIGPLTLQVWGFFAALGLILGTVAAARLAKFRCLESKHLFDMAGWVIIGAIVGARLFHVIFYEPGQFIANPIEIFYIWHGGSSFFGGFIGALIAGFRFLKKRKLPILDYVDVAFFGIPLGAFIGRIGCFLIHDHPGTETNFFLGAMYADGVIRHDHGLYLSINGLLLFIVFLIVQRFNPKPGIYIAIFSIWYGAVRFILDFYRAYEGVIVDTRYAGLTPSQYISIGLFVFGIYMLTRLMQKKKML